MDGDVERGHGPLESRAVDPEFVRQFADCFCGRLRRLSDAVLIAQEVRDLRVEDLKRRAVRLLQNFSPVLRVCEVAKVRAFVHEAVTVRVHDDPEGVGVLLVQVADASVAEQRRVQVPSHGVTTAPVAVRRRSRLQRHPDTVPGVKLGAAHLGVLPVRPEMLLAHLAVRLEPAAREYNRASANLFAACQRDTADRGFPTFEQTSRSASVPYLDARLLSQLE